MKFDNANEAFEYYYELINKEGILYANTKALFNQGFYIEKPVDNNISSSFRNWNLKYAEYEWQWYLNANPNAEEISKRAPIWISHMDKNGDVRSNYGWQWNREDQLTKVIEKLKIQDNRQAVLSFYDGKEIDTYEYDTPCTMSVHFQVINKELCMTVNMRSNDLWFGFCNDQYCFSRLQELIAEKLNLKIGWYYHFASNLHVYFDKLNKNK
jgi:thymidylate synthase